jgi:hypothetical protein
VDPHAIPEPNRPCCDGRDDEGRCDGLSAGTDDDPDTDDPADDVES